MSIITRLIKESIKGIDWNQDMRVGVDDEYLHYITIKNVKTMESVDVIDVAKNIANLLIDKASADNVAISIKIEDANYNNYHYLFSKQIENQPFEVNDENLRNLWEAFGDTPIDDEDNIDDDFFIWKKGTDKMYIWQWFDKNHTIGLAEGLMYKN